MKKMILLITTLVLSSAIQAAPLEILSIFTTSNPETIAGLISSHHFVSYLVIFFVLGIFLAFTPCVLPMVPILSSVIAKQGGDQKSSVKLAIFYVLGMAVSYAIAGMSAGYLGGSLQSFLQIPSVIIVFSILIVLMGFALLDVIYISMPIWIDKFIPKAHNINKKNSLMVFFMGAISVLVVSPCVTAPLIGILTFISQSGQTLLGGAVLFVMALGMGLPLILFAAGQGALLPKAGNWMNIVKILFAYMMFALALIISFRVISANTQHIFGIALAITFFLHIGMVMPSLNLGNKVTLATLLVLTGTWGFTKLLPIETKHALVASQGTVFENVNSKTQLTEALNKAKKAGIPSIVVFHATWCSDCVEIDENVFSKADVAQSLNGFAKIRVDLSENNVSTKALKKRYHVPGTPTTLFYDEKGKQLTKLSAAGVLSKSQMLALIKQVS